MCTIFILQFLWIVIKICPLKDIGYRHVVSCLKRLITLTSVLLVPSSLLEMVSYIFSVLYPWTCPWTVMGQCCLMLPYLLLSVRHCTSKLRATSMTPILSWELSSRKSGREQALSCWIKLFLLLEASSFITYNTFQSFYHCTKFYIVFAY